VVDSRKKVNLPQASGYIKVISSDAGRQEGINASLVIMDELHAHKNRDLYDCLAYAGVARHDPLFISITTAGHDKNSLCYEEWQYAKKIIDGSVTDTAYLAVIYSAEGMDPIDEESWRAANPSLGKVLNVEDFRGALKEAQSSPVKWNTFLRYRLNIWVDADDAWIDVKKWDECKAKDLTIEELYGETCFGGIDLGQTSDLNALALYFPAWKTFLQFAWVPKESAIKRTEKNHAPYLKFAEEGSLTLTEGDVADYNYIQNALGEIRDKFNIQSIAIDPWAAQHLTNELEEDGYDMAPFRQGFGSLSSPSKEFERMILSGEAKHLGDGLLRWCVSNVVLEYDAAGNIKPSKRKSSEKIDPVVCCIMALGMAGTVKTVGPSVYEERGVLLL